jgi:hypothetical protein
VAKNPTTFSALAIKFVGHPSDDVAKIAEFLNAVLVGEIGKLSFSFAHLKPRWPRPGKHYDARAWLQLEIISQTGDKTARPWLKSEVNRFKKYAMSRQEKRVLNRIWRRVMS